MSATLEEQLKQGEAAALYAAQRFVHFDHFAREWREEWELIASNNQAIRDALRKPLPTMAEPITLSLVEDENVNQESIFDVGLRSEQGGGGGLGAVRDVAGVQSAA